MSSHTKVVRKRSDAAMVAPMIETWDIVLRLVAATLAGAALGLNRDLHNKPTGVRTLGLVGLGAAIAVLSLSDAGDTNANSRVVQGTLTGIGFLGAGVIIHNNFRIHGLTTAACTWLAACIGIVCGTGAWRVFLIGIVLTFILLLWGGPFERATGRLLKPMPPDDPTDPLEQRPLSEDDGGITPR